jgi:hypothetical protein
LGITKSDSSRWQKVAGLPEAEFDRYIEETVVVDTTSCGRDSWS